MSDLTKTRYAIIVMGVSGSGKTSVAESIAKKLGMLFVEGDALHPTENIAKMSAGIPLTDDDRWPWLDLIGSRMQKSLADGDSIIVSCSALKRIYRERLRHAAGGNLFFVYLHGTDQMLKARMSYRQGHFMPTSLLESQLATLEVPTGEPGVVTVEINDTIDGIAEAACLKLAALGVL